ncbi:MAG TPA: CAP domain-containing protein [Thermoleophilaceae bacterium]|nr:CAP domain-containing protein [Thermoleophilaceae bacterium]
MPIAHLPKALALALVLASAGLAAQAPSADAASVARHAASCRGADGNPLTTATRSVRRATLCLLNAERRGRGLGRLRSNSRLARAAARHARDMVRNDYFSHDSLDGRDFVDRILNTNYVKATDPGWVLGENLAWGSGRTATPRQIVRGWMASPGHRRNILGRRYREVGIAVVRGVPQPGARRGATYATEFGRRRRR